MYSCIATSFGFPNKSAQASYFALATKSNGLGLGSEIFTGGGHCSAETEYHFRTFDKIEINKYMENTKQIISKKKV